MALPPSNINEINANGIATTRKIIKKLPHTHLAKILPSRFKIFVFICKIIRFIQLKLCHLFPRKARKNTIPNKGEGVF